MKIRHIRRALLAAWPLLASGPAVAATNADDLRITPLKGALYLVEDDHYLTTNSLVYVGAQHVTIAGATWTPETAALLATKIRAVTALPVKEVIIISPDPEWAGGSAYWKSIGATLYAASATCDLLSRTWAASVERFRRFRSNYPELPLELPTQCQDGDFDLQGGKVKALFLGASHTPGDIFVYFPDEEVLNAGSILKEQLGNMAGADVEEYPRTLQRLKDRQLRTRIIVSGHYSPLHGPELIDHYLRLLGEYVLNSTEGK